MPRRSSHSARNAVALVEAAYSLEGSDSDWLGQILEAAAPDLDHGRGTYAFLCRIGELSIEVGPAYVERKLDRGWSERVAELNRTAPDALFNLLRRSAVVCGGLVEVASREAPAVAAHFRGQARGTPIVDGFSILAQDGEGHAIDLTGPSPREVHVPAPVLGIWRRVGIHLAAASRLRRHCAALDANREALLEPGGRVEHAEGLLRSSASARELLTRAASAVERARTRDVRRDPARALDLWQGLIGGQWSLVDHWEADGRRYLAAYRNTPNVRDPRALSAQERLVLRYASLGCSNKEIAFTLGLSGSAVAESLARITRKLRCRRRDLLAWNEPQRASHVSVSLESGELGVLAMPHALDPRLGVGLSEAQRDIASRVVRGESNAQIARARGTSAHTVANQLQTLFRHCGVQSRTGLVRTLTQPT